MSDSIQTMDLLTLFSDPVLMHTVYQAQSPLHDIADSGAVTINAQWEQGQTDRWYIELQRRCALLITTGLLHGTHTLIERGWRALTWGFRQQDTDGSFPTSAGAPLHTSSFFIEAAARSLLLLQEANSQQDHARIVEYSARIHASARWLTRPEVAEAGRQANMPFTHRRWLMAAALGQAARLTKDAELAQHAASYAHDGLRLQTSEGVNPELSGYDVRYQYIGVFFATVYALTCADPLLRAQVSAMITRALDWLATKLQADGTLGIAGSTRVGIERNREGAIKTVEDVQLVETLALAARLTGDLGYRRLAARIAVQRGLIYQPLTTISERASAPSQQRRFAFVFVCQSGELENRAVLLAASLRRFLRCRYELFAAVPTPTETWGEIRPLTRQILESLGVCTVDIQNPIGRDFPNANKIPCLSIPTSADKVIFLDSDILCVRDFNDEPRFAISFNAKPSDVARFALVHSIGRWHSRQRGLTLPDQMIPTTTAKNYMPPYFNGGFVAVDRALDFGSAPSCLQAIRQDERLPAERAYSDQIGLAAAVRKLNLAVDCLDERYNFPVNIRRLDPRYPPYFAHYHDAEYVRQEPLLRDLVRQIVTDHPQIKTLLAESPVWQQAMQPPATIRSRVSKREAKAPELIITGISRSGTSYLCNLLHRYSNCVILNEPEAIFAPLQSQFIPWGVATFYRQLRADVLDGRPIRNKLQDGKITQDTAFNDSYSEYVPTVDNENFVLGSKNNVAYLSHLARIRRVLPDARVIVCVRNPFDTIGSWKKSFAHLRDADINNRPIGHPNDVWLPEPLKSRLQQIAEVSDIAQRRALLWQYFAERVLDHASQVQIVHYDALVSDPMTALDRILDGYDRGTLREPITASAIRLSRDSLDEQDRLCIRTICSQAASELGVYD
ncbi:MAG: sulfotransferase [Anaerolineae bacterium]